MHSWIRDFRFGLRNLVRHPGFMLSAVLALSLGIGANTAIFSVIHAVILKPLPYDTPNQLAVITEKNPGKGIGRLNVSLPDFLDWRKQSSSFSQIAAYTNSNFDFRNLDQTDRIQGIQSSANLFQLLGIEPAIGRSFMSDDDQPGKGVVAIVSNRFWRESLHSDAGIIGRPIVLNSRSYTVIGVMPDGFQFPPGRENVVDVWVPLVPGEANSERGSRQLQVIARLKRDVNVSRAQLDLEVINGRLQDQYPDSNKGVSVSVASLKDDLTGDIRPALLLLMGAVILVLLTSCANVANLLLVRSARREKEMAIRTALGARRGNLIRLLLAESAILAICSCALGLAVADIGLRSIVLANAGNVPRLNLARIDTTIILFAILISLFSTVLFGFVPALITSNKNLTEVINEGSGRTSAGSRQSRTSQLLIVVETVMGVVLLVSAGLLGKSLIRLQNVNPGFEPADAYTMRLTLPPTKYNRPEQWPAVYRSVLDKVQQLTQVSAAGITTTLPLSGDDILFGIAPADQGQQNVNDMTVANFDVVSPDYFRAMGISLKQGRFFNESDTESAPKAVIINEALARLLWAGGRAVGKTVVISYGDPVPWQVVGVVGNVKRSLTAAAENPGQFYLPYQQVPLPFATLVLRSSAKPGPLFGLLRARVSEVSKDIPAYKAGTLGDLVSDALGDSRFRTLMLGVFAGLATILAIIGIYSVMAAYIADRQIDIGVRMALGATRRQIFNMVVGRGMLLTFIGEALGIGVTVLLSPVLSRFLYGVSRIDPFITAAVLVGLASAAFVACSLPASKAGNMDPYQVLRK